MVRLSTLEIVSDLDLSGTGCRWFPFAIVSPFAKCNLPRVVDCSEWVAAIQGFDDRVESRLNRAHNH